jgi:hypothetical protein
MAARPQNALKSAVFLTVVRQRPLDAVSVDMPPVVAKHVQGALNEDKAWHGADPDRVANWDQIFRTNGPAKDTGNRGVSDPAGRP